MLKFVMRLAIAAVLLFGLVFGASYYWLTIIENNTNWDQGGLKQLACVTDSPDKQELNFTSMGNAMKVSYVAAAADDCITPHFPIVLFESATDKRPNAWIQVIHSKNMPYFKGKPYVDSVQGKNDQYPFYGWGRIMSDAPSSSYPLIRTETREWVGHAYGVIIDKDGKVSSVVGGVRWGYRIEPLSLWPKAILPTPLAEADWQQDFAHFIKAWVKVRKQGHTPGVPQT